MVNAWTNVPKPAESSIITFIADGSPVGMLMAITRSTQSSSIITGWTDVPKATSSLWSLVAKPTT